MRRFALSVCLLVLAATPLAGQGVPGTVKYGKWGLLVTAVGLNLLAADAHHKANQAFQELERRCAPPNEFFCDTGAGGEYLNPDSEAIYQRSLSHDRRARLWLISGETVLLGAAALFIYELSRPKTLPPNKPFEPEVKYENGVTRVGVRLAF